MKKIQLLDCTLRDGGYLNDWEFGHNTLVNIFERIVSAGIDIIEVGFLDDRRAFDIDRSIMPDTESVEKIYGELSRRQSMVVGMIDYGTCAIHHLQSCQKSYLDGIRVIFKQDKMRQAIEFCGKVKLLGYKVFVQAVSITTYSDESLLELVELVNGLQPYALSIVDTYGLLHQSNLYHIFEVLDQNLHNDIGIGYHAHNNFQMGYANGIKIMESQTERPLIIDGTLYGIGKSAGNTPLELLAMYMNEHCGKQYDINQILEAIETNILEIYNRIHWGYNLFYYLAASNKVHPNYVSYLMNQHTLSIKSVNEILKKITDDKKLLYDKNHIDQLYRTYESMECDDAAALDSLAKCFQSKELLVLGPGKSYQVCSEKIQTYNRAHRCIVLAVNFIPEDQKLDYLFLTNSKRYLQIASQIGRKENADIKVIATSNVTKTNGRFDFILNYGNLIDSNASVRDNSLLMLMRALISMRIPSVALAGFDGYEPDEMNYFKTNMEYSDIREKAKELNQTAREFFRDAASKITVKFITESKYCSVESAS